MSVHLLRVFVGQKEAKFMNFGGSLVCVEMAQNMIRIFKEDQVAGVLNGAVSLLIPPLFFKDKNLSYVQFLNRHPLWVVLTGLQVAFQFEKIRGKMVKVLNTIELQVRWTGSVDRSVFNDEKTFLRDVVALTFFEGFFRICVQDVVLKLLLPKKSLHPFIRFVKIGVSALAYYKVAQHDECDEGLLPIVKKICSSSVNAYFKECFGLLPALVHGYSERRFDFFKNEAGFSN
jgi:hypothetical protein